MNRLLQLAFWAALLFALVAALWPQSANSSGNPADKLQHIAAFFTLAVLGGTAYPRMPLLQLFALLTLFGGLIELAQLFPGINRHADSADLIADVFATGVGVLVLVPLRRFLARG